MKKLITAVLGGTAVASLAFASASTLLVDGGTVQVGSDTVTCDGDGVKANWGLETDDDTVRSVRISGISEDCKGAEMWVQVNGTSKKSMILTGAESQSISYTSPFPSVESIENIKIWIEG